jgi:hypothetical protein
MFENVINSGIYPNKFKGDISHGQICRMNIGKGEEKYSHHKHVLILVKTILDL